MISPIHVLLLDESAANRAWIRRALKGKDFALTAVPGLSSLEARLAEGAYHIVLTELRISGREGLTVLRDVQARAPGLPVVVITGRHNEALALEAVKHGASDYLIRSAAHLRRVPHLISQLVRTRRRFRAISAIAGRYAKQAKQRAMIMAAVPQGLALLDADGRIVSATPAFQGYLAALTDTADTGEVTWLGGRPLSDLFGAKGAPYHELICEGPPARIFESRAHLNGSVAGMGILEIREVTQQRESRERALQQERLAAVGQMAAGVAHDFNNILAAITGYAELLQETCEMPEQVKGSLSIIQRQGFRAAELVRQMLDFSRQSVSKKSTMDLKSFCKETVKLLQRTIQENIAISLEAAPADYRMMGDPGQLQQILMNLAVNARDAMPVGGRLDIRLSPFEFHCAADAPLAGMSPGKWLLLAVSDTGTGIAPAHLPHLFEPFFTTKRSTQGTGLGLSQVYGLVGEHGGFIEVATKLGEGTTFRVYLPPAAGGAVAALAPPRLELLEGKGEGILVVEDNPAVRKLIATMIKNLGYRVLTAKNGRAGLALYRQRRGDISLVLTDWVMPKMDGAKLTRALRAFDPTVRMLVMSGYPLAAEPQSQLAEAGVPCLQKPVGYATLSEAIRKALETETPRTGVIRQKTPQASLRILLLENCPVDAELIELELRQAGLDFSLDRVESREGLVSALAQTVPDLILSNYGLPGFDGLLVLRIAQKHCPDVPFIFVSGHLGEEMAIETLKWGATDYVLKKRLARLAPAVHRALSETSERRCLQQAEEKSRHLFNALQRSHGELQRAYDATIQGWCRALDMRNRMDEGHTLRVTESALRLAGSFGIKGLAAQHLRFGATLYDIGKMAVPDATLQKTAPLDDEEWEIMRRHPVYAYALLSPIEYLRPALDIPYCHHERWDGSGYPRGLSGDAIPFSARLFAVADVCESMRSERPYRKAVPESEVLAYLKRKSGTLFDPIIVERFLEQRGKA